MPREPYITISENEKSKAIELINLIDKLKDVKKIKNLQNIIEELDENELIDLYRTRSKMPIRNVSNKPKVICDLCNCKVRNGGLWEHKQTKKCKRMIAMNELKDVKRKTAKIDDNGKDLVELKNKNKKKKITLTMKVKYIELVIKLNKIHKRKYEEFKDKMRRFPLIKEKLMKKTKYIVLLTELDEIYDKKYQEFKYKMEKYPIIKNKKKKKFKIVEDFKIVIDF